MDLSGLTSFPAEYRAEKLQRDHFPQMLQLLNLVEQEINPSNTDIWTEEWLVKEFDAPGLNLADNLVNVFKGESLVLIASAFALPPYVAVNFNLIAHPDHRTPELTEPIYALCEANTHEFVALADPQHRVIMRSGVDGNDRWLRNFLEQHGFSINRAFWEMRIDMEEPSPTPDFGGLHLRPFNPEQQMRTVYDAMEDAFRDHYGYIADADPDEEFKRWRHHMTSMDRFDPTLWFVLYDGDEIAGFSLCHAENVRHPEAGHVSALGVRTGWRQRGLGTALLLHSFNAFWQRGKQSVTLHVDAENITGATRLYEKAGMYRESEGFSYEKELRPGTDPIRR